MLGLLGVIIHSRNQGVQRGHGSPQIFKKHNSFGLWGAFFQTQ